MWSVMGKYTPRAAASLLRAQSGELSGSRSHEVLSLPRMRATGRPSSQTSSSSTWYPTLLQASPTPLPSTEQGMSCFLEGEPSSAGAR